MGEQFLPGWAEQTLGAILLVLILLDIFLTVLYARAGVGIFSNLAANLVWRFFRAASKLFGAYRGTWISLCGPAILVLLVFVWGCALALGAGMIIHPALGTSVTLTGGETPTDFTSAVFAGGGSLAFVGASDFTPQTGAFRILFFLKSLVGTAIISLTLTYLMQIYSALQRRNAFALKLHLATGETGDAAELLAGIGADGKFDNGYNNLAEIANEMAHIKESHHFYAVLFFFRFSESFYSMTYTTVIALDAVCLIESALDADRYGWLQRSMSASQLRRASLKLLENLAETFISSDGLAKKKQPDRDTLEIWRARYFAALDRFERANITVVADREAGFEIYADRRAEWDHYIEKLAPQMAYKVEEIDCAGSAAEEIAAHRPRDVAAQAN